MSELKVGKIGEKKAVAYRVVYHALTEDCLLGAIGDMVATLEADGVAVHSVNVDHLLWESFYYSGWVQ